MLKESEKTKTTKKKHMNSHSSFSLFTSYFNTLMQCYLSLPTQGHGTDGKQLSLLDLDSQSLTLRQLLCWVRRVNASQKSPFRADCWLINRLSLFHLVLDEFCAWRHACYLSNKLTGLEEQFACHAKPTSHVICKLSLSAVADAFREGSQ